MVLGKEGYQSKAVFTINFAGKKCITHTSEKHISLTYLSLNYFDLKDLPPIFQKFEMNMSLEICVNKKTGKNRNLFKHVLKR